MINYPMRCPLCFIEIDSLDSMSDTQAELAEHIRRNHPDGE